MKRGVIMPKIEDVGLKDNNGKLRVDLVTAECIEGMAEVLGYGARKYKANSWQNVENGKDEHYAALLRHLLAWRRGEINDPETNLNHIKHVLTNAMFLLYHDEHNKGK